MKLDQALHGTLEDATQLHTQALCSFLEFGAEGIGDGSHKVDGKPGTAVLLDVAHEEINEAIDEQMVYLGHIAVLGEERSEAGQESVCQGLTVYLLKDDLLGESVLAEELIADGFGKLVLEAVAHEAAAQHGAATFVAEDITQWGNVGNDLLTIV